MKKFCGCLIVSLLIVAPGASAQSETPAPVPGDETLVVGTKEAVPFAIRGEDGSWSGISIDLLDLVMTELGWDYELRPESLDELLDDVSSGELDMAISAITITPEREVDHDFSHGYFSSGLGIAVSAEGGGWQGFIRRLFSAQLTGAIGLTVLFLLLVG
ncbi:MAG: transporter substrate-binding domain-containing protein, partial [Thermoanaerobaculia bacterium]|nr:transporter substrate-binding domain-containing protein [Thermoanaerobaculia bacterium]